MATISQLDTYFTTLVSNLMVIERQPLQRLQASRDRLDVRRAVYTDLTNDLKALQDLTKPLRSTYAAPILVDTFKASVLNAPAGTTVLSASAGSSAVAADYDVSVTHLATSHRIRSDAQPSADQVLNLTGTISLGGAATRSQSTTAALAGTVEGFDVADPASGQTELGSGTYSVETRQDATAGWQFRIVNAEGQAVSIRNGTGTTNTSAWQAIPAGGGAYDTGRGLTLDFGTDSGAYQAASHGAGAAQVAYTAQGARIAVAAGDSLNTLAQAINQAAYAEGQGVVATVVDRQLVLTAKATGLGSAISVSNYAGTVLNSLGVLTAGGAIKNVMQTAQDAEFVVNGLTVHRGRNTGLSDVISGVTLNLAGDAEGRSATLRVSTDTGPARAALDAFVSKFNAVTSYLQAKSTVSAVTTGATTTYTRGALADDTIFGELRGNLFNLFMSKAANSGPYQYLRDIGLAINDNLQATVVDSAKLEAALSDDLDGTQQLLDIVMDGFNTELNRFTAADKGYLGNASTALSAEIKAADSDIAAMNRRLTEYEEGLVLQFGTIQAQLLQLSYMKEQWASIYNTYGSY
jgi:flagellar hook-associated protein 2